MMRYVFLLPVAAFAALALWFAAGLGRDPGYIPSMLIDRPAPQFSLPPIAGRDRGFSSEDLKGEVSMVNIFGSWCATCEIEHPVLMEMAREGVAPIYGLNWKDRPGQGARWLREHKNPYIAVGDDPTGRAGIEMGVTGVPETFVIDRDGRIRYRHAGPVTEDVWREIFTPLMASLGRRP